jgi:hypothetical protein
MTQLRVFSALLGGAILGGGFSGEIHLWASGNATSGGFAPVGVIAGIGLGLLVAAFLPAARRRNAD